MKLKPCRYCRGTNIKLESWQSGGHMCMVKCNNPDCPVPPEGYPTGRETEGRISKLKIWRYRWIRKNMKR